MKNIQVFYNISILLMALVPAVALGNNPIVRVSTSHGEIDIELYADKAPQTVANFMSYADSGHYNGTIFHRVIDGFMVQGGGFTADFEQKPTRQPIPNEAYNGLKNEIGTLAMARTRDPHSATAQFFINVNNNTFLNFGMRPYGPVNTLRQSQLGVQDSRTQKLATSDCKRRRIARDTLEKAAIAKPGDDDHYACLMQSILNDPNYSLERELAACLPQINLLKQEKKLSPDATCSNYVDDRHKALKLVHVSWGYAVFGKVINGMEVVDRIKAVETGSGGPFGKDVPKETITIQSIQRLHQEASQ